MIDFTSSLCSPELLALGTSICYATTLTLVRRGMATGTPLASMLVLSSLIAVTGLVTAFIRGTLLTADLFALFWFTMVGIVGNGTGNLIFFFAIQRLGVSRATSIHASTPIWAVIFAVLVLGEQPGIVVLLGTISIVGGICLLSWPDKEEKGGFRNWMQRGMYLPVISSVCLALAPIFVKLAFAHQNAPYLGFGVAFGTGLLIMLAARPLIPGGGEIRADRKALYSFLLGAPTNIIAAFMMWTALSRGMVSSVMPLSRMTPLWVVLFSYLFLKRYESVRLRTLIAALLVVGGGILITLFR